MTVYGITEVLVFGVPSAYLAFVAVWALYRWLRRRRDDRECAQAIARRVRDRRYPGLPDDGHLETWEWDEWDRIETFYGVVGVDPYGRPQQGRPS